MSNAATNGKVIALAPYLARPNLADELNREELAELIGQLEQLKALCWARLLSPAANETKPEQPTAAHLDDDTDTLTAAEAAAMLRRKPSWIYRHTDLPFILKRDSPRDRILCSKRKIQRYLAR